MIKLRDYQATLIEEVREKYRQKNKNVLCVLPTGGGKSIIIAYMAHRSFQLGRSLFIVVHRSELVEQLSETLSAFSVPHGIVCVGKSFINMPIQVCSVQTLIRRLHLLNAPDTLVVDECHHLVSGNQWGKVIDHWPEAALLGLTATPERLDGKGLGECADGYFQSIVEGPKVGELISRGYLTKYKLFAPPVQFSLEGVRTRMGDYDKKQLNERLDNQSITGDAVEHYKKLCPTKKGITFCCSVEHSKHVAEQFNKAGITAAHLDGGTNKRARRQILNDYREDKIQVLTNVSLFTEGFDVPGIEVVQLLRPTQSLSLSRQMIGRGLRLADGKTHAIILDHVRDAETHGLPDDEQSWSLEGRKRGKGKPKEEKLESINNCPVCFFTHRSAPLCPACGHVYAVSSREIEVQAGDLKEITENDKAKIRAQKRARELAEEKAAETFADWQKIERERGYKPGWARHKFSMCKKKKSNSKFVNIRF